MKLLSRLSLAIIPLTVVFTVLSVTEAKAQVLNEILKRMDAHQKSLSSLRAKITMEKYDSLIRKRNVYQGTAIYSRRDKNQIWVKVDWTTPPLESLSFVNGQYVLFRPRLKMAMVGIIGKAKEKAKVNDALSFLKMSRKELQANYSITYLGMEKVKGEIVTLHLGFTPKKPTIYKSAELWVDSNGMPIQTKVFTHHNDSTTVLLSDLKKNEIINSAVFQINLPKGTKIIKDSGASCPCFKPENSKDALKYWSDAVFSGKVVAVNGADYTFKTERMWKKIDSSKVVVRSFSSEYNCAIKLTVGERYIVFAQKVDVNGKAVLGLMPCNFTTNIESESGKKIQKEIGKGRLIKKTPIKKKRRPLRRSRNTRL